MDDQNEKRKSQAVAGILWLFCLHQFYLGKPLIAIAQLLTAGGALVWWIVDGLKFLRGLLKIRAV